MCEVSLLFINKLATLGFSHKRSNQPKKCLGTLMASVGFVGGVSAGEQGPSGAARGLHTAANRDGGGGNEHV
jgi:hypothetical protein